MNKLTIQKKEIDTRKSQWLQSDREPELVVLTTGGGLLGNASFSGTAMPCKDYPEGCYRTDWIVSAFHVLEGEIPFIISN